MCKRLNCAVAIVGVTVFAAAVQAGGKQDIVDTAIAAGDFTTLVAAVQAADLVDTLKGDGPFTVFAPTDEAFNRLPAGTLDELLKPQNKAKLASILTFHVVPGRVQAADVTTRSGAASVNGQWLGFAKTEQGVSVENANMVKADIACKNGVIHVIDTVVLPVEDNIAQVAASAGSFKTLLAAAEAAGLSRTLAQGGPFTVFAPTDEAFAKLGDETLTSLLEPENREKLAEILKYHIVSGRVFSPDALAAKSATTLQGGKLAITQQDGKAMVGEAGIVATDIDAANGVIHVIDTVLMPS